MIDLYIENLKINEEGTMPSHLPPEDEKELA
jgi:hypothetical protein